MILPWHLILGTYILMCPVSEESVSFFEHCIPVPEAGLSAGCLFNGEKGFNSSK